MTKESLLNQPKHLANISRKSCLGEYSHIDEYIKRNANLPEKNTINKVEPEDSNSHLTEQNPAQNLKEILQTCIERPEEIRRKAAKAKEIAKQHSWKAMADQYCGFYQSLCGLPKE